MYAFQYPAGAGEYGADGEYDWRNLLPRGSVVSYSHSAGVVVAAVAAKCGSERGATRSPPTKRDRGTDAPQKGVFGSSATASATSAAPAGGSVAGGASVVTVEGATGGRDARGEEGVSWSRGRRVRGSRKCRRLHLVAVRPPKRTHRASEDPEPSLSPCGAPFPHPHLIISSPIDFILNCPPHRFLGRG